MGHNIDYFKVDKKSEILATAENFAFCNVDREENRTGSYHGKLRIIENRICNSFNDAIEFIERSQRSSYDDMAVQFYDTDMIKDTAQITTLRNKITQLQQKKKEFIAANDVSKQKSKLITCPHCESRVNKDYIRYSTCPICQTSLRSNTVKMRIEKFEADEEKILNKITELQIKNKNKAKIRWCVKVEVHC